MAANEPPLLDDGAPDPERGASPTLAERLEQIVVRLDALRDRPALALAAAALAVAVAGGVWWLGRPGTATPVEAGIPLAAPVTTTSEQGTSTGPPPPASSPPEPAVVLVHVAGAVRRPGLVTLAPGDRIADAVTAAGGPTPDADLHRLNLAAPVADGLQVRVPVEGEEVSPVGVPAVTAAGSPASDGGRPAQLIDLNTATAAELETLPGIGPALAAAIVEWRASNGPFATAEDLLAVPGIGPAKLDGLADLVIP